MAMTQRTLYRLIEKMGGQEFAHDDDMIRAILHEIILNERISISGGRIWKLVPESRRYMLLFEEGIIEAIGIGFSFPIKEYPALQEMSRKRTILASETNSVLRKKGIFKYSATGFGELVSIAKSQYYEYMLAFNTTVDMHEFRYVLNIVGQALTQLLQNRRSEAEKRILQSDMEHARELQRRILPEHEYRFGRFDLYGVSLPERLVGGDFFNYYKIPGVDDRLAVAVGDAASKGLPAAVQALFVSGALMMSVEFESKISSIIRRINNITCQIFPNDRFLTLFYCELFDSPSGLMLYSNAGHPLPLHYHADTKECTELTTTGTVIGLVPEATYGIANCNIMESDIMVLYTDGITEANDGTQEFGERRLMRIVMDHAEESPKAICQHILQEVQQFSALGEYSDDKTVVVIKRVR